MSATAQNARTAQLAVWGAALFLLSRLVLRYECIGAGVEQGKSCAPSHMVCIYFFSTALPVFLLSDSRLALQCFGLVQIGRDGVSARQRFSTGVESV